MGFFLTLLYICVSLLSPASIFPGLAGYRIELILAGLAVIFSVPRVFTSAFLRTTQVYLLMGLLGAVFLSQAIGNHWAGGGVVALQDFFKTAIAFFLIVLNVRSLPPFKIIAFSLAVVATFFVLKGVQAYASGDTASAFVVMQTGPLGTEIMRVRGLGFLNDPNDLAQFLLVVIPVLGVNWQRGRAIHNTFFVTLPVMAMTVGIYLTHSRGALLGLLVIMLFALKDRLGTVASAMAVLVTGATLLAANFSGGRAISMEAGADRMAAWGAGLQFFKSSPLFGIGYGNFANLNSGLTAHNSFVLCLGELGIVGYSLWVGLLVVTIAGLNAVIAASKPGVSPATDNVPNLQREDLYRWATMFRLSFAGFIVAGWFLSRAYVLTLYLLLGMATALIALAVQENESIILPQPLRLLARVAWADLASVTILYALLRARAVS